MSDQNRLGSFEVRMNRKIEKTIQKVGRDSNKLQNKLRGQIRNCQEDMIQDGLIDDFIDFTVKISNNKDVKVVFNNDDLLDEFDADKIYDSPHILSELG